MYKLMVVEKIKLVLHGGAREILNSREIFYRELGTSTTFVVVVEVYPSNFSWTKHGRGWGNYHNIRATFILPILPP